MEPEQPQPESELPPGATGNETEHGIIEALLGARPPRPDWVTVDAGSDCAVVFGDRALKVDTMVGGVHFDGCWRPDEVGYKAVAAAVSDLGAAGAEPEWLLLSVSTDDPAWGRALAPGVARACARFSVHLVGGDVTRTVPGGPAVVSASVGGRCVGRPLTRAGARPGDALWVTGTVGLAGLGWSTAEPPPAALAALRCPEPPVAFALDVARAGLASAAMDLSDGLRADLPRLAAASGVRLVLDPAALPLAPEVGAHPDALSLALSGGEDYELLLAAAPADGDHLVGLARRHGVRLTRVGAVLSGSGVSLSGRPWPAPRFSHFAEAR